MTCRYCGTDNDSDDHRCNRCGRRLHSANARPAPDNYAFTAATAPALHTLTEVHTAPSEQPAGIQPARRRPPVQPSLFPSRDLPQVIPFESYAPENRGVRKRPSPAQSKPTARAKDSSEQRQLEFGQSVPLAHSRNQRASAEAVIYCDAAVASPIHRILAFAIDIGLVLIGVGMFLLTYNLAGGAFPQAKYTLPIFGLLSGLVYVLYEALWCVSCADTPGMRWARLRLLDFDGREPDLRQRLYRLGGSLLSVMAAGIGLLWALTDEESLTWHDHMSNTFPTCVDPQRS